MEQSLLEEIVNFPDKNPNSDCRIRIRISPKSEIRILNPNLKRYAINSVLKGVCLGSTERLVSAELFRKETESSDSM